jgi:hypothetical protein
MTGKQNHWQATTSGGYAPRPTPRPVCHEKRVETASLQRLDEVDDVLQVEVGVGIGARITPPGGVESDRAHERTEMKVPDHRVPDVLVRRYSVSGLGGQRLVPQLHTLGVSGCVLTDRERLPGRVEFQVDCLGHIGAPIA